MSKEARKANVVNFVVGIVLVLFALVGMIDVGREIVAVNIAGQLGFILLFVLVGGYEVGKYAERRHNNLNKGNL
jgi:uncharacterized membrane protein